MKVKLIKQHDEKDCGAACLSMILEFYGKKVPLASVREAIKVDQHGANIYGMVDGADKFDLIGSPIDLYDDQNQFSPYEVWDLIAKKEVHFPFIARIVNKYGYEHFIVVENATTEGLAVCDPGEGKIHMGHDQFLACFLGQVILYEKKASFIAVNERKSHIRRLGGLLLRQKKLLLSIAVCSLGITLIGFGGAYLFQVLLDHVAGNMQVRDLLDEGMMKFAQISVILGFLYAVRLLAEFLRGKLLGKMSKNLDLPLTLGYYDHVTELPMSFFHNRKTGEIMSRFQDAAKIRDAISGAALTVMIDVVMAICCAWLLFQQSALLFQVSLVIFTLYAGISVYYCRPLEKANREVMEENALFNSYLKETIDGIETVKVSNSEKDVRNKVHGLFCSYLDHNINGGLKVVRKEALIHFITSAGTLLMLFLGVREMVGGRMTAGTLISFYSLQMYFLSPVQNLVNLQADIQAALVAADRLDDVMDMTEEEDGTRELSEVDSIEFEHVCFRYGNRNQVLRDLNFRMEKGTTTALVGASGCGKSTAARLVAGLYEAESGNILFNGNRLQDYSRASLKEHVGYVTQDTFLFSDSVYANLVLGIAEGKRPSEEEVSNLLKAFGCDFVFDLPLGIHTILEENGRDLSGGQRQKLSIVRALLRKPELLILDEATSALDTAAESKILSVMKEKYAETTVLMIAHRLSTVKEADQILVLDNGTVSESGKHQSLLKMDGQYTMLWKKQSSGPSVA